MTLEELTETSYNTFLSNAKRAYNNDKESYEERVLLLEKKIQEMQVQQDKFVLKFSGIYAL